MKVRYTGPDKATFTRGRTYDAIAQSRACLVVIGEDGLPLIQLRAAFETASGSTAEALYRQFASEVPEVDESGSIMQRC